MARSLTLEEGKVAKLSRPEFRFPIFKVFIYILLTAGALLFVMPFLWMLFTSLMTPNEIARGAFIPRNQLIGLHKISDEDIERPLVEFLYADATLDFTGTAITLEVDSHPNGGVFKVFIDDQQVGSIDSYAATRIPLNITYDSYPANPALTDTQALHLPDEKHTLRLVFAPEASAGKGNQIAVNRVIVTLGDGTTETISTGNPDFEANKGYWEAFALPDVEGDLKPVQWDDEQSIWVLDGVEVDPANVVRYSTDLGFPDYFQACCYNTIDTAPSIQVKNHTQFIRQDRLSGSHEVITLPFSGQRYIVTGGVAHYARVWEDKHFGEFFINTVQIALLVVAGETLFAILAAYAFAKMKFPGRNLVFSLFLITIFIPTMVTIIPNLLTVTSISKWSVQTARDINEMLGFTLLPPEQAKWIDNWPALVIPFLSSTFSIFLLRQFFVQIPDELWDAAQIDGAGHLLYLFRIVVPISRAAITTVVLFAFIGIWDALEWPLLVISSNDWKTISMGVYELRTSEGLRPNLMMAGSMMSLVPIIIMYFIAQREFTEGIATTGLKG